MSGSTILVDYFQIRTIVFENDTRHTIFRRMILCSVPSRELQPEELGDFLSVLAIKKQATRGEVSEAAGG